METILTMETKCINRSILDFDDSGKISVEIPEWDGHVYVRRMSSRERIKIVESMEKSKGEIPEGMQESIVILTCVDEQGHPIFTASDKDGLSKKAATAIDKIFNASARLNGLISDSINQATGE